MDKIILVDSSKESMQVTKSVLERCGYEVISHDNGQEALAALQQGEEANIILLDTTVPEVRDDEFAQKIKELCNKHICIALITENRQDTSLIEKYDAAGCINKPFKLQDLLAPIAKCIENA